MTVAIILFSTGILTLAVGERAGVKIIGLFLVAGAMVSFFLSDTMAPPVVMHFSPHYKDTICIPTGPPKEKEILAVSDPNIPTTFA